MEVMDDIYFGHVSTTYHYLFGELVGRGICYIDNHWFWGQRFGDHTASNSALIAEKIYTDINQMLRHADFCTRKLQHPCQYWCYDNHEVRSRNLTIINIGRAILIRSSKNLITNFFRTSSKALTCQFDLFDLFSLKNWIEKVSVALLVTYLSAYNPMRFCSETSQISNCQSTSK